MRDVPYWLNIGSILHQYGCATRAAAVKIRGNIGDACATDFGALISPSGRHSDTLGHTSTTQSFLLTQRCCASSQHRPISVQSCRGVARNLLRGGGQPGGLGTEDPSGVQGQNTETPSENTNGTVTKIDLRWRGTCTHAPSGYALAVLSYYDVYIHFFFVFPALTLYCLLSLKLQFLQCCPLPDLLISDYPLQKMPWPVSIAEMELIQSHFACLAFLFLPSWLQSSNTRSFIDRYLAISVAATVRPATVTQLPR